MIVIAGKGHETTQTVGSEMVCFDDRQVAREELNRLAEREAARKRTAGKRAARKRTAEEGTAGDR